MQDEVGAAMHGRQHRHHALLHRLAVGQLGGGERAGAAQRQAEPARELADHLDAIRGRSIRVEVASLEKVLGEESYRPAALFVSQRLATDEIRRLVDYAVRRHVIVFSPFEGDVERGILGGISVEATVRPLINMQTLSASGLAIKAFYLKVAKRYGGAQP